MKLRCDLNLGSEPTKIYMVSRPEEKMDHLALKLAAVTMFSTLQPLIEPSKDHPALNGYDLRPDVCYLDDMGTINIWIECGNVSINKINKVERRWPQARVIILKALPREAIRMRKDLKKEIRDEERIEVWAWKEGEFKIWYDSLGEKIEIFGEAGEKSLNLVVNETPISADLDSY